MDISYVSTSVIARTLVSGKAAFERNKAGTAASLATFPAMVGPGRTMDLPSVR